MFEFATGKPFGMYVADFLDLQCSLQAGGKVDSAANDEEMLRTREARGQGSQLTGRLPVEQ